MENFIEQIIIDDLKNGRVKSVATRFPPEPNGYLHIGHAKSVCLNFGLAIKHNGSCNLRFDDTNPEKEDEEYVNAIIEDVKWLGFEGKILFSSDYFGIMYDCAVRLIKKGLAYVCALTPDEVRKYRGTLTAPGKNSPYRERGIEENLMLFEKMKSGVIGDGELTLRAKIDMASPNINMRDPIIYRVLHESHHRTKNEWCIYPMYDFAHPIEDAVEKISHSICTLEFEDHRPFYDWVIDNCDFMPKPHQYEFARLNLTRTIMSKRYLKKLVDEKKVDGWDDPRMPTLSGMRRRGYPAKAIRAFCEMIGVAKANSEVDASVLEFCVRNELNTTAPRRMVVLDPIELVIENHPSDTALEIDFSVRDGITEKRKVAFGSKLYIEREDFMISPPPKYHRLIPNGMVRLKGAYIFKHTRHETDENGRVLRVFGEIIPNSKSGEDESGLKVKGVIHWVEQNSAVSIIANKLDYLLNEDTDSKDFSERLNPLSKHSFENAKAEPAVLDGAEHTPFQFLRQSYFYLDKKAKSDKPIFNEVVSLKESFNPNKGIK